jgi:peptidoglycan/xylan/chitin deacetylase (PgdA/CDA1 family)
MIFVFGLLFVGIVVLVWASANIRSGFYLKTINSNPRHFNEVGITFDDGPDAKNTPQILDLLAKYNAKATFFVIGQRAKENSSLLNRIAENGHIIGNHSYGHSNWFPLKLVRIIRQEILETNAIIEKITNKPNRYFRPPFGVLNPSITWALVNLDLITVGWSIRSLDTQNEAAEIVFNRIKRKIKGGDIILLHDTSKNILEILEKLLIYLSDNKIKAVTIDELMRD